jgi:hypothetical protein
MLICVCLRILASSRIPDMILGDKPLISEVVLSQQHGSRAGYNFVNILLNPTGGFDGGNDVVLV